MNLEQFKKLDQAGRDAYGDTIQSGVARDSAGGIISFKKGINWLEFILVENTRTQNIISSGAFYDIIYDGDRRQIASATNKGYTVGDCLVTEEQFNKFIEAQK